MRNLFLASVAGALILGGLSWTFPAFPADLRVAPVVKAPSPVTVYAPSWTGCYGGAGLGYGGDFTGTTINDGTTAASLAAAPHGFTGGVNVGCDYQVGALVLGLGLSGNLAGFHGDGSFATLDVSNATDWYATLNARLGLSGLGPLMPYVTGGAAIGGTKTTFSAPTIAAATSQTSNGWDVGAGLEVRLGQSPVTLYGQTLWVDLGDTTNPIIGNAFSTQPFRFLVTELGLRYRF